MAELSSVDNLFRDNSWFIARFSLKRMKYFFSTANNLDLDDKYPVLNYEDENDLLGEFTQIKELLRFFFKKGKWKSCMKTMVS